MPGSGRPPSRRPAGSDRNRPAPTGRSRRSSDQRSSGPDHRRGDDRPGRGQPGHGTGSRSGRPPSRGSSRGRPPASGRSRTDRPTRPQTAAEQRAAEVNATRPRRPPRDPDAEQAKIEGRTLDTWIDEGALRDEAVGATARATAPVRPARRRQTAVDPATVDAIRARDPRRADELTRRLTQAQEALDRERFDDARRIASSIVRQLPDVAAVHEVIGLAAYRTGRWRQAVTELELAQSLHPSIELLPVLADTYRAMRRWTDVERVWADVRAASPAQEVLAEARIVAAGAQLDQGDLQGALRTMSAAAQTPKKVRDHHLRQWYVLGDLHDRAGDPIEAARWFRLVADNDPDFVDVVDRLRALGR